MASMPNSYLIYCNTYIYIYIHIYYIYKYVYIFIFISILYIYYIYFYIYVYINLYKYYIYIYIINNLSWKVILYLTLKITAMSITSYLWNITEANQELYCLIKVVSRYDKFSENPSNFQNSFEIIQVLALRLQFVIYLWS